MGYLKKFLGEREVILALYLVTQVSGRYRRSVLGKH
jgi:ABC-type polysaccharide/polyol phosphate export permease